MNLRNPTHSVNGDKDGYNLLYSFFNNSLYGPHSILNSYILVTPTSFSVTVQTVSLFTIQRYPGKRALLY